ncbi:DMT family transporter [Flectobacillus roseus]|jgi:transporter family-2 protein|uniref:DMT family transporter n=1 Tax=Flectobacillus roseus TaxID=502259 RepID=UPI0014135D47|nr:DMT family transporter [Flectobacillus roseus]MDI9868322.1 DMT family transporter [Flectobacillus roseus]NBA74366.1 EamA-like transporter family protein [Emticicia sp. ODNR4P]
MQQFIFIFLAFLCGAVFPTQAAFNGKMAAIVGHPILAAILSFITGLIALIVYAIVAQIPMQQFTAFRTAPWYVWLAGILGAFYVSTIVVLMPRLGVALTFGLVIAGQMTISILMDHFGLFNLPVREISAGRLLGALLLLAGVVLIRKF